MKTFLIVLSVLIAGCATTEKKTQPPVTNWFVEHRRHQCEDFESEYLEALRWCSNENLAAGSREASCFTARNYEQSCSAFNSAISGSSNDGIDARVDDNPDAEPIDAESPAEN